MPQLLTGILLLLLLSQQAVADYDTGERLYADCISDNYFNKGYCGGYVTGIIAALVNMQRYHLLPDSSLCVPDDISKAQLVEAVRKYLDDHAQYRSREAVNLVPEALNAAFPCRK